MKRGVYKRNLLVPFLKMVSDAIAVAAAVLFSYYLRFLSPLTGLVPVQENYVPPFINYAWFAIVVVVIFVTLFTINRSYRSRFFPSFNQDLAVIFRVCIQGILAAMSVAFLYRGFSYSRITFVLIFLNTNLFLFISRFFLHRLKRMFFRRGYNTTRVFLVGSRSHLGDVFEKIRKSAEQHFEVLGYLCDVPVNQMEIPRLGNIDDLQEIIAKRDVDGLIVAFSHQDNPRMLDIMKMTEGTNVELFYIADILNVLTSSVNQLEVAGIPVLQLKAFTLSGWQGFLKRGFDIVVSALALLFLAPLFILMAILIKMSSKGPIFYKQQRVSLDDRDFTMIKFRSMQDSEESKSGLIDVVRNDPRVTKIGRFMRRTSIDELPQLWNVLKGEMSLVGPRPERRYYVDQNALVIPRYTDRHRVRCGITGWAQVNGLRQQDTSLEERIRYDLFYIENWSLAFDLKIILMTFAEVLRSQEAY